MSFVLCHPRTLPISVGCCTAGGTLHVYTVDTFAWAGKKVRQNLGVEPEPGQSSSAVVGVDNNNTIPPQPFFHTTEGQPLPLQGPPDGSVGYGEDASTSDLANTWTGLDRVDTTNMEFDGFSYPPSLPSSSASLWPMNGPTVAPTPSWVGDTSFRPSSPLPRLPPGAGASSTSPGPKWQVVGVKHLGHPTSDNVDAVPPLPSRPLAVSQLLSPLASPVTPSAETRSLPSCLKHTSHRPDQRNRCGHDHCLDTTHCTQCGHQTPLRAPKSPVMHRRPAIIPGSTAAAAPLCFSSHISGLDLSQYGIVLGDQREARDPRRSRHGVERDCSDDRHRRGSCSHYRHCHHCNESPPPHDHHPPSQENHHFAQRESDWRESHSSPTNERVVLVYLRDANQVS